MSNSIHIILVDDEPGYLKDTEDLLKAKAQQNNVEIEVLKFNHPRDFLNYASQRGHLDIVVMDYFFGYGNESGVDCIHRFNIIAPLETNAKFIMSTSYGDASRVMQALAAGVKGYYKKSSIDKLFDIICEVKNGNANILENVKELYWEAQKRREDILSNLTKREKEVLDLLTQGHKPKDIALILGVSVHAVNRHINSIYDKIRAADRDIVCRMANGEGWLSQLAPNQEKDFGEISHVRAKGFKSPNGDITLTFRFAYEENKPFFETTNNLKNAFDAVIYEMSKNAAFDPLADLVN